MPCFLTVNCRIADLQTLKKALLDAGIKTAVTATGLEGVYSGDRFSYDVKSRTLRARLQSTINKIKQHYALIEVQTVARQKGMKVSKKLAQDGSIELVLTQ